MFGSGPCLYASNIPYSQMSLKPATGQEAQTDKTDNPGNCQVSEKGMYLPQCMDTDKPGIQAAEK